MSVFLRSRLVPFLRRRHGRFLSSVEAVKEPIISSQTLVSDHSSPTSSAPADQASSFSSNKWLNFLKYTIFGALTGVSATAGYVSYAFSLDEVEEKTKALRAAANFTPGDDSSGLAKFPHMVSSAAVKVPAKAVDLYLDLRKLIEEQIRDYTEPNAEKLLPDLHPLERHVFTLVLDLNETLVYSDWTREKGWQTFKRPGVDAFLEHLAQFFEIVVYSDQESTYVDPVLERLDPKHCVRYRLSRAATKYEKGHHYRDLSKLNRDLEKIIYLSGHALENSLQPENSLLIKPWKSEADDTALLDFIPFLEYVARNSLADIRRVIASYKGRDIPTEFIRRSGEHQKQMQEQKSQGRFWRH